MPSLVGSEMCIRDRPWCMASRLIHAHGTRLHARHHVFVHEHHALVHGLTTLRCKGTTAPWRMTTAPWCMASRPWCVASRRGLETAGEGFYLSPPEYPRETSHNCNEPAEDGRACPAATVKHLDCKQANKQASKAGKAGKASKASEASKKGMTGKAGKARKAGKVEQSKEKQRNKGNDRRHQRGTAVPPLTATIGAANVFSQRRKRSSSTRLPGRLSESPMNAKSSQNRQRYIVSPSGNQAQRPPKREARP